MKLHLVAVGRLRKGPEKALVDDYLDRFAKSGRTLGLPSVTMTEVDPRGGSEALAIDRALPDGTAIVALDERGKQLSSPAFADLLAAYRDRAQDVAFVIGGADGLTDDLRGRADRLLAFGPMVWPHMLARVMLSEQLYRAASILAGSPYHRA
ncbi:MAG: 23S rRNA (pseudouridine(1915)-N(3))-methyltransferase RlmH [Pseudomonadota bacterium]